MDADERPTSRPFDAANYLKTEEAIADFLTVAFEPDEDYGPPTAEYIAHALGIAARARQNMSQLARDAGLSRQGLINAINGETKPTLETVLKLTAALGYRLTIVRTGSETAEHATV
jgi:probable addiction module antidote protein